MSSSLPESGAAPPTIPPLPATRTTETSRRGRLRVAWNKVKRRLRPHRAAKPPDEPSLVASWPVPSAVEARGEEDWIASAPQLAVYPPPETPAQTSSVASQPGVEPLVVPQIVSPAPLPNTKPEAPAAPSSQAQPQHERISVDNSDGQRLTVIAPELDHVGPSRTGSELIDAGGPQSATKEPYKALWDRAVDSLQGDESKYVGSSSCPLKLTSSRDENADIIPARETEDIPWR